MLSPRLTIGAIPAFTRRILREELIKVTDTSRDYLHPKSFISGLTKVIESSEDEEIKVLGNATSTLNLLSNTAKSLGISMDQVNFELIEPAYSDPKKVILESKWRQTLELNDEDIEQCINAIVQQLRLSDVHIRSHH